MMQMQRMEEYDKHKKSRKLSRNKDVFCAEYDNIVAILGTVALVMVSPTFLKLDTLHQLYRYFLQNMSRKCL
jgi:hypothetical protein